MSIAIQVSVQRIAEALAKSGEPFVMEGGQIFVKWDSISVQWHKPLFGKYGTLTLTFHYQGKEVGSLSLKDFDPESMTAHFSGVQGKTLVELSTP